MKYHRNLVLFAIFILAGLLVPAVSAVDPLWTAEASTSGELSGIVISADGSTVVAGGDQLVALSRDGRKLWTGWSGSHISISWDGNYILTSRDQTVRLISGTGTMLWDESITVPVTDVDMLPDASLIAAGGANRIRLMNTTGSGFKQNTSITFNHFRLFPRGDRIVMTTKDGVQISNLTLLSEWTDTNVTQDLIEMAGDGSSFVTVTNNRVRRYNGTGGLQWNEAFPGGNALGFAYSRDGSTIVVGRDDNSLLVLDRSGELLWTARASHWVTSVAVSNNGNTIVAGSMDKILRVYDRSGTLLGTSTVKNSMKTRSVAVSGDGSLIAAIDGSQVYGFSRSQFTAPVTATTGETTAPVATTATTPAPATTTQQPAVVPTPQAALIHGVPLAAFVLVLFFCSRRP